MQQGIKAFTLTPAALRCAVPNMRELTVQLSNMNDDIRIRPGMPGHGGDIGNMCLMLTAWADTLQAVSIDFRGLSAGLYHRSRYYERGLASFLALNSLQVVRTLRLEGVDLGGCDAVLRLPTLRVCTLRYCYVPRDVLQALSTSLERFSASNLC
jgi:hypothetical protein